MNCFISEFVVSCDMFCIDRFEFDIDIKHFYAIITVSLNMKMMNLRKHHI